MNFTYSKKIFIFILFVFTFFSSAQLYPVTSSAQTKPSETDEGIEAYLDARDLTSDITVFIPRYSGTEGQAIVKANQLLNKYETIVQNFENITAEQLTKVIAELPVDEQAFEVLKSELSQDFNDQINGRPPSSGTTQVTNEKATYELLAPILDEKGNEVKTADFPTYLRYMFIILISLASVIAVLMIVIGGVMYMTSAGNESKTRDAKEIIQRTLFGMILIIASWLIIFTINPNAVKLDATKGSIQNVKDGTPAKPAKNVGGGISSKRLPPIENIPFDTPQGGGATAYTPPTYTPPTYTPPTYVPPTIPTYDPSIPPQEYTPGPGGVIPPIAPTDDNGWTAIPTEGKIVRVASGQSIAAAINEAGSGGQVLLESGGTWNSSFSVNRSNLYIGSYGSGNRPLVRGGIFINSGVKNLKIVNLHLNGNGSKDSYGISMTGNNRENILIEGNLIENFSKGIASDAYPDPGVAVTDLVIRRNVIVDNTANNRPQGIYIGQSKRVLIEENVFDRNGTRCKCAAATFDHNLYIQEDNENVTVRGNIVARASSHGVQLRSGGVLENNLFLDNPINVLVDQVATARNNVVLGSDYFTRDGTRVGGIGIEASGFRSSNTLIENNIVAHKTSTNPSGSAVALGGVSVPCTTRTSCKPSVKSSLSNITFKNNIVDSWSGTAFENNPQKSVSNLVVSGNSWQGDNQRSARTLRSYVESLNGNGGIDAFMNEARKQSKANWRPQFTAAAVTSYIRQGYGR